MKRNKLPTFVSRKLWLASLRDRVGSVLEVGEEPHESIKKELKVAKKGYKKAKHGQRLQSISLDCTQSQSAAMERENRRSSLKGIGALL